MDQINKSTRCFCDYCIHKQCKAINGLQCACEYCDVDEHIVAKITDDEIIQVDRGKGCDEYEGVINYGERAQAYI